MHINEEAVSFAAFSLVKVLAAELLRNGILDRQDFVAAISAEIDRQRGVVAPRNADAATLLAVYCEEI